MQAVRLHPAPNGSKPYSPTNPAPPSALKLDKIPTPKPSRRGEILIRVKATTAIRDALTWPETYATEFAIPGNDFSGIVEDVFANPDSTTTTTTSQFKRGDQVFGMTHADRGSTWAEYTIVHEHEATLKPETLPWEKAACLPLSGLTAFQALFEHAGLPFPADAAVGEEEGMIRKRVLITGSSGGVGIYLVQLAAIAGLHVVAASSSTERNGEFLRGLGADEVVEYSALGENVEGSFDLIVDTVGGEILRRCWSWVSGYGTLISVDSASFDFVNEHRKCGTNKGKEDVRALFFIVRSDAEALRQLATLADRGRLKLFVLQTFDLSQAQEAYEQASSKASGYGKVVIQI
ncbi:NADP-dependent oxidoreductase [Aspergillus fischeri NRRL 181]|uniref:Alcohol dehydrogenase n=1 Tax=Neosartorya fischeri (strain ATCC 1020 / DSM 3700 / CBS 544.65 / FGSC A1164 / JCM 1740 / NRRL 181 / WB 181) TaxID=331117 RepID=A1D670_NEOFI|nr:alcohol dehydrogenase [Aspergillus fischeri NRRL 181]EAW21214.1 alcohol dehydrogenase [Aspergillus fischeri NRRL 181]